MLSFDSFNKPCNLDECDADMTTVHMSNVAHVQGTAQGVCVFAQTHEQSEGTLVTTTTPS